MNIPQIMGFRFATPISERRAQNTASTFGLTMASPLSKDTVSFRGTPKIADKAWEVNKSTASLVRKKLDDRAKKVFTFIEGEFDDLIATDKFPKNPILAIWKRLKSETSIAEKTGSRKWTNIDEIMEHMTDLIGMKFVMRNSNKSAVDSVLDRFIPLIKSGKLELLEIENKRPMVVKGLPEYQANKYDYASIDCLKKMAAIQNDVNKKGGKRQKVKTKLDDDFTDANYCAIHFLFRLMGKKATTFELQLLGNNMNEAKHIDDFVWKKLNGKNPQGTTPAFDKLFEPFSNRKFFDAEPNAEQIVADAKEKMDKYRANVFLFQRDKADLPYSKKKKTEMFLPMPYKLFPSDIELKYGLSSLDFDFNNIAKLLQQGRKKTVKVKTEG